MTIRQQVHVWICKLDHHGASRASSSEMRQCVMIVQSWSHDLLIIIIIISSLCMFTILSRWCCIHWASLEHSHCIGIGKHECANFILYVSIRILQFGQIHSHKANNVALFSVLCIHSWRSWASKKPAHNVAQSWLAPTINKLIVVASVHLRQHKSRLTD